LRRLLASLLRLEKRGDAIQANVGPGARDVVIGKNIIRVGTTSVPTLPVVPRQFSWPWPRRSARGCCWCLMRC
jgi:hypothetical protein